MTLPEELNKKHGGRPIRMGTDLNKLSFAEREQERMNMELSEELKRRIFDACNSCRTSVDEFMPECQKELYCPRCKEAIAVVASFLEKKDWKEVHINKASFGEGETKEKFWVVGYNAGGIGTPLYNVDEDIKWFIQNENKAFLETARKELQKFVDDEMNWLDIENSVGQVGVERNSLIDFIDTICGRKETKGG